MKHLILGSSGQVGSHLKEYLLSIGEEVIDFDIINSPVQDLRVSYNLNLYDKIIMSDYVYFLAFDVGGSKYLKQYQDSYEFIDNNMKIMNNVIQILSYTKKPFLFTSSQMSNISTSSYGLLKAIGEKYTNSLNGLVVRLWNIYGYESPTFERSLNRLKNDVVTDFIQMATFDKLIKMRTDGSELRQMLYASDCAKCMADLMLMYDELDKLKNYHISSFTWSSIYDIALEVQKQISCEIIKGEISDDVQFDKQNKPDPYILELWKPTLTLSDGISEIIRRRNEFKL